MVFTHPIGIGKVGWRTPEGVTKIVRRQKDPTWRVPVSVRKEHHENGEELEPVIGPGPDNPLGKYAFYLQWPSYLIHGTNKPAGVGLRSSHGCIRLYPEDIEQFFNMVPVGTQVRVVNQPFVFGWRDGQLYMQPYDVLEDDSRDWTKAQRKLLDQVPRRAPAAAGEGASRTGRLEARCRLWRAARAASRCRSPLRTARWSRSWPRAPRVQNTLPEGSTWDGQSDLPMDEATFKQMLPRSSRAWRDGRRQCGGGNAHRAGSPRQDAARYGAQERRLRRV